jgi:antitoxin (DNA-binding transcriptional repressor) of toxin-antitoxin stability system
MIHVSIEEAKTNLSSLITQIQRSGEKIIIQQQGKAVAELCPVAKQSRIIADPILKNIVIKCNLASPTETEWEKV